MLGQMDHHEATPHNSLSTEVGAALASVWARHAGARPESAKTVVDGDVVRWTLAGVTNELEEGLAAAGEDPEPGRRPPTMTGYRRELSAAVARVTHRSVKAMISKQDAETGSASETFILERQLRKA